MSGSVLAFSVPTAEYGVSADLWMMPCMKWRQQHGQAAELSSTEDGSVSPGGGTPRVIGTHRPSGQSPLRDVRCLLSV